MFKELPSKNGIALNITRTRVTVLVFNLTIILLVCPLLAIKHSPYNGLSQLSTSVALFMGFCLTLLGLWLLLFSQNWGEVGLSRPVPFKLQISIYWVYSRVWYLEFVPADQSVDILSLFALQFVQPLL